MVHGLLQSEHLERFYDLRGERGPPIPEMRIERRDRKWLEAIEARRDPHSVNASGIELDLQGIHCSACVWLLEKVFSRREGAVRVTINPTLGRARLVVLPSFDLAAWAGEIERFGYIAGPPLKHAPRRSSELALRMGVCIAIAMNAMIFAIAEYAGLTSGATSDLFHHWSIGLSILSVLVGGSVFFRSAWEGVRRGMATLDLPIALGLLLAFVGSLVAYGHARTSGVFFDTLDVFVALMLVGRYLQERALERNRQTLLDHDGVEGLLTRREEAEGPRTVKCTTIAAGDRLVLAPGDLLPVDARLEDSSSASFSLDWINGESRPHRYANGASVPAGAFLAGETSVRLIALDAFERSPLIDLVKTTSPRDLDRPMSTPWWTTVTRI
ncbi:MAG: heavy metal translocating P-type ATPase, partial [Polyangiaceae bacterium]